MIRMEIEELHHADSTISARNEELSVQLAEAQHELKSLHNESVQSMDALQQAVEAITSVTIKNLQMRLDQITLDHRAIRNQIAEKEIEIHTFTGKLSATQKQLSATRDELQAEKMMVDELYRQYDAWKAQEEEAMSEQMTNIPSTTYSETTPTFAGND